MIGIKLTIWYKSNHFTPNPHQKALLILNLLLTIGMEAILTVSGMFHEGSAKTCH
jgi:hypothetical protein